MRQLTSMAQLSEYTSRFRLINSRCLHETTLKSSRLTVSTYEVCLPRESTHAVHMKHDIMLSVSVYLPSPPNQPTLIARGKFKAELIDLVCLPISRRQLVLFARHNS
jgi:hypothetical protein